MSERKPEPTSLADSSGEQHRFSSTGKVGPTRSIKFSLANLPRLVGVLLVRGYQVGFKWMPPTCRYHPSCSQYTLEAIEKYGLLRGSWMGAKRIARCGPWHPGGHDPVP